MSYPQSHNFNLIKVSSSVYCIIELDIYHEQPHIYVIIGDKNSLLIDTGCGTGNLRSFISAVMGEKVAANLIIINTHNHFDHIAGNHHFTGLPICASSADQNYTNDPFTSMSSIVGCDVKQYKITRWLNHLEKIPLSNIDPENYVQIFLTPGHTPDSLCLWYPKESRLFVGDLLYRYAPILCITVKSSPTDYEQSVDMLVKFANEQEEKSGKVINISSGHIDSQLESDWLREFAQLLRQINNGQAKETGRGKNKKYRYYATEDGQLNFQVGSVLNEPSIVTD